MDTTDTTNEQPSTTLTGLKAAAGITASVAVAMSPALLQILPGAH